MNPADFIKRFRYRKGRPNLFGRDIRKTAVGDCTSFAWSVLLILEDGFLGAVKAQITGKAMLWRVKSPVNGFLPRHVALRHYNAWVDSTDRKFRETPFPHKLMWPLWCEKAALFAAIAINARMWGLW